MGKYKQTLKTYYNIKPIDRLQELELHTLFLMSGEDIVSLLNTLNPTLEDEYYGLLEDM